jgi:poly(hydroxyalkanoate) depolymerase family esterase
MKSMDGKLFVQMRDATRQLMKNLKGKVQPVPAPAPVAPQPFPDPLPELMAKLDLPSMRGFSMPQFDLSGMPGIQGLPGMPARHAPAPALPGRFIADSYTNEAGTRSYKVYVPSSVGSGRTAKALPLVVMLHGCTQDPDDFASGTQMNALAEESGAIVVYPAQSQQANPSRCWNWFKAMDQQRDMGEPSIIAGITRQVCDDFAVDRKRIYVAGLSAGGAMAAIMGKLYPDLYAAVGVHSGLPFAAAHDLPSALAAMQGSMGKARPAGNTLPVIVFHGDRDTTVHPANGDAVIAQRGDWPHDAVIVEPGRVPDGHAYTRTVHQRDGAPNAEQWLIHGAGHAWSGGSAHGSYTDGKGPDASREMLRFFKTAR